MNLRDIVNRKCRYHDICHNYAEDAFTCQWDREAKDYCGTYRTCSSVERKRIAKPFSPARNTDILYLN
jgi:hypothetical protein